jgi:uncharacterized membrane protein YraQ (UPF0718 family)
MKKKDIIVSVIFSLSCAFIISYFVNKYRDNICEWSGRVLFNEKAKWNGNVKGCEPADK